MINLTIDFTPDPLTGRYSVILTMGARTVATSLASPDDAVRWARAEMAADRRR